MTEFDVGPAGPPTANSNEGPVPESATDPATGPATGPAREESPEPDFGQQSLLPPATTGEPGVDAALAHLHDLDEQPVTEHVAAFERVHAALAQALSDQPSAD
jgi:hypothetical protein